MSVYRISLGDQGNVTIFVDVDLFELSARQRDLVFGLIDDMKALAVTHAADGGGALVADIAAAMDPAAVVAHVPPSTTSSPAGDKQRRAYTAAEKEVAVLTSRRHGPARTCRELGISSTSLLRHWTKQYAAAGGIPPTWHRNGKPGPASHDEAHSARPSVAAEAAVAQLAKAERAEFVDQLDATKREVLAASLEREGVDLAAIEAEGGPAFPDAGPMEHMPVVETRARDAAAEALYDGM